MDISTFSKRFPLLEIAAWSMVALVYFIILSTLKYGISCDEGYYLMGYLHSQEVEMVGTDFHNIVKFLSCGYDGDIMFYRYLRLGIYAVSIILFAITSHRWLHQTKGCDIKKWVYYPFVLLAGAIGFTFAAPTISYDHLGVLFFLSVFSFLFLSVSNSNNRYISAGCILIAGFFGWYSFANYPPAGFCLWILVAMFILLEFPQRRWISLMWMMSGMIIGVLSYHYIHPLGDYFTGVYETIVRTFTEKSMSRHDSQSLITVMLRTIGTILLWVIPAIVLLTLLLKKVVLKTWMKWVLTICTCGFLLVYRPVYQFRGNLFIVPLIIALSQLLAQPNAGINKYVLSKRFLLVLLFAAIPIVGVFGTNQSIMTKAVIFTPFWLVSYVLIRGEQCAVSKFSYLDIVFMVLLTMGYMNLGNFSRYHYYYTPRSSKVALENVVRGKGIKVSSYQKQYFEDVMDTISAHGFHEGDPCVAFGENQITVYLAGGYIAGKLPYHWWQYHHRPKESPKCMILFKSEEADVLDWVANDGWNIPKDYSRIEMRRMSENMGEELGTVLFIKK